MGGWNIARERSEGLTMIDREKIMTNQKKITDGLKDCISLYDYSFVGWACAKCEYVKDRSSEQCKKHLMEDALKLINAQSEELKEIREDMIEMSNNGGTGNQQEVCRYLLHRLDGIEKRLFDGKEGKNEK